MHDAPITDCSPPQTRQGEAIRLLACVGVSALAWWDISQAQWADVRNLFWLDLGTGLLSFVLVLYRRRWPFGIAVLLTAFSLVSASSAGPGLLAFVSLATRRRIVQIAFVGVLGVVVGQLFYYYEPNPSNDPPWVNFTVLLVFTVAAAAIGMYLGSRRELIWSLRDRASSAETQQELRVAQARSAERERIAREMHDVLAHKISLVTLHAGALSYRTDLSPEQIRETAGIISTKAQEALADLREVLGALRAEDADRPQPTLAELPRLIQEATESGMRVGFTSSIAADETVPDRIGRTLYRITQEALTNARKHAPGAAVTLTLHGSPGEGIDFEVRNGRRSAVHENGDGFGVIGMRERVEIAGGTLRVHESADEFVLEAWLPWTP